MKNLSTLPSDEELERLDDFLLERIDEEADTEGKDEGVLVVSELDGFLTAIVSGPVMIPPSQWLPAVWGDFEPVWESEKDFGDIFSLMTRHMNGIANHLMEQPQDFEPIYHARVVEGKTYTIVDEWCEGYMRGVALAADAWDTGGQEMTILLAPILAFTSVSGWRAHDMSTETETDNIRNAIIPNVREIHAYWLARRQDNAPSHTPVRRTEPQVGRNDPCPCGSGKKYKKCCLH
ncbi:MAG: UPF0149 family protein YecA [Gammaproteobacteria bacterium]|nr:MAG: UPF0149 family protein YecA [Gammaproteobacteria bacterium]